MTGFDKEGFQPDEVPEQSEGNRLIVRIVSSAAANEQSGGTEQNSGKTGFARCFWGVSEQFSRYSGAKKMEPMTGFDEEGFQPDEVPEQSEGNRLIVRIASLTAANEQSGGTNSE